MIYLLAYVACIPAANWAITQWGAVPVGFGLYAPAGVLFAGVAFTLRDLVQERMGKAWCLAAIGAGAILSLAVSDPFVAAASAAAFLVSELLDFAVYVPMRRRGWLRAVAASNAVGLVVDSTVFLWLLFGDLAFLTGQILAKAYMTALAVGILWAWRRYRTPSLMEARHAV